MASALMLLLLLQGPDDPAQLIEGLRSEKLEERIRAEQSLKKLGRKAVPALERVRNDADAEVSKRAARLLLVIPVQEKLTPTLMKEMPGLEERLAVGEPHAWTEALVAAADRDEKGRRKLPNLQRADFDVLVPQAFQAMKEEDLDSLCGIAEEEELRSAVPGIVGLIRRGLGYALAQEALEALDAQEAVPDLVALLQSQDDAVRWNALWGLIRLDAASTAPQVRKLLKDHFEHIRMCAAQALGLFGDKGSLADLRSALQDEHDDVRRAAALALGSLESKEVVPDLVKLLKADYNHLRSAAAAALGQLRAVEARADILKLVEDTDQGVRISAIGALADLGAKESIGDLRALLGDGKLQGSAGRAMVRLGSREGVPGVLRLAEQEGDFYSLFYLNALRRPEAWAALGTKRLGRDLRGRPKDTVAAWAREAGMAVDEIRGEERVTIRTFRGKTTLCDALWYLSIQEPNGLVFESDRIRSLPQPEALKFWKEWWAAEQQK